MDGSGNFRKTSQKAQSAGDSNTQGVGVSGHICSAETIRLNTVIFGRWPTRLADDIVSFWYNTLDWSYHMGLMYMSERYSLPSNKGFLVKNCRQGDSVTLLIVCHFCQPFRKTRTNKKYRLCLINQVGLIAYRLSHCCACWYWGVRVMQCQRKRPIMIRSDLLFICLQHTRSFFFSRPY